MSTLLILNRTPYDSTDVTWNALRLAGRLLDAGEEVRVFLMNEAIDLARDACEAPEDYDQDLTKMLKYLIARGVVLKACSSCMARGGVHKNEPYFDDDLSATMPELAEWVLSSDKVLTF